MATTLDELENYFCNGPAHLGERQALCKARVVWASPIIVPRVAESLSKMLTALPWKNEYASDIQRHRLKLEQGAAATNIKRGRGGTLDIEFIVQMLQLKFSRSEPSVLVPGTLQALASLHKHGVIDHEYHQILAINYRWLRRVESGLRLMNLAARHELPQSQEDLDQLQFLLQHSNQDDWPRDSVESHSHHPIVELCAAVRERNRQIFNAVFAMHGSA